MDAADPSPYDVLGVSRTATPAEVRKAYLRLARQHHPDFHAAAGGATRADSERRMQRINEAWAVLGDPERRRAYDERCRAEQRATRRPGAASYDFTPYDDEDDVDHVALLDDTPVEGTSVSRASQVLPAVVLLAGAATFVVGALVRLEPLVAVGVIGVVLGLLGFLVAPATAIARSIQAEREP